MGAHGVMERRDVITGHIIGANYRTQHYRTQEHASLSPSRPLSSLLPLSSPPSLAPSLACTRTSSASIFAYALKALAYHPVMEVCPTALLPFRAGPCGLLPCPQVTLLPSPDLVTLSTLPEPCFPLPLVASPRHPVVATAPAMSPPAPPRRCSTRIICQALQRL